MAKSKNNEEDFGLQRLINMEIEQRNKKIKELEDQYSKLIGKEKELQEEIRKTKIEYGRIIQNATEEYEINRQINKTISDRIDDYTRQRNQLLEIKQIALRTGDESLLKQTKKDLNEVNTELSELQNYQIKMEVMDIDSEVEKLKKIAELKNKQELENRLKEIQDSNVSAETKARAEYNTKLKYQKQLAKDKDQIDKGQTEEARKAKEDDRKKQVDKDLSELLGMSEGQEKPTASNILGGLVGQVTGEKSESGSTLAGAALDKVAGSMVPGLGQIAAVADQINKTLNVYLEAIDKHIEAAVEMAGSYLGPIDTRLQGMQTDAKTASVLGLTNTGKYFNALLGTVIDQGTSVYINQNKWMENIAKVVDAGIASDIEGRALIMTLSDRIVTTFNALDSNILRLVRLQQSNITASQAGVESGITQFLNEYFNNTEYLGTAGGQGVYDTVLSSLTDSLSQMNTDQSTSFLYAVQKWLGALYSLGLSDQTAQTIASGLNLLSTGNVSQLSGSPALQTLFALSAERSGISYADILTGGLDADIVDRLMKSMVEYLGEIAHNTSNQVLKSEWSSILGISVSDLRAFGNLTQEEIEKISSTKTIQSLSDAEKLYKEQYDQVRLRTTMSQLTENFVDNLGFTFGAEMVKHPVAFMAYKVARMLDNAQGDLLGSSAVSKILGASLKLVSALATVPALASSIAYATKTIGNLFSGDTTSLDALDSMLKEADDRGDLYGGLQPTAITNTLNETIRQLNNPVSSAQQLSSSVSVSTGSSSTSLMSFSSYQEAVESKAQDIIQVTEENNDTIERIYSSLFESDKTIKVNVKEIDETVITALLTVLASKSDVLDILNKIGNNDEDNIQILIKLLDTIRGV